MIDAISFSFGDVAMKPSPFSLPDTSGLTPLSLPDIVFRKGAAPDDAVAVPSAMPSAESISRFERAMSGGAASPDIHRTILRVTASDDAATSRQAPSDDATPAMPRIFQAFARDAVAAPSVHPMIAEETAPLQETASLPKATPLTEETPIPGHQDPVIPSAGGAQVHSAQTNAEPPRHIPVSTVTDAPFRAPAPAGVIPDIPDAPQQAQASATPATTKIEGSEVAQRNPITADIPKTDAVPANVVRDSAIPVEVPKTDAIPVNVPQGDAAPQRVPAAVGADSPRPAPAPAGDIPDIPDAPQQVQAPTVPATTKIEGSEVAQRNTITVDIPRTDAVPANVVRDSAIPVEVPKIEVPKTGAIPVDVPQGDVAPQRVPAAVVVDSPRPAHAPANITSDIPDAPQQIQAPAAPTTTKIEAQADVTSIPNGAPKMDAVPANVVQDGVIPQAQHAQAPAISKIEGSEVAQRNPITVDIPKTDAIPVNVPQGDAAPQHIPAAAVTDAAGVPSPAAPTPATTTVDAAPLREVKTEPGKTQQLQAVDSAFLNVAQPQVALGAVTPVTIEIDPSEASARTAQLVEVAEAVTDTILVTPALVRGEGKVTIRLKPTVLDGSEIHLEAKGTKITVTIAPATDAAQQIVEQSKAQLAQTLVQRLPSFQFAVMISPRLMADRKGPSDETT